ncbi:hypothetical protein GYMLUDRAFT_50640 [Collybiopsis luxurians FD-317 M1]|uniref:Uncharacterized protein n=1 Tax=Collybiopsis luxurians FD-317 M1 TaxID=944289 RepID=A0A0D0AM64_9AGAR|nr:hypothetical protein GYMLUDRAFT_50640 [Collybiopsis luxurians FD-317 M1]
MCTSSSHSVASSTTSSHSKETESPIKCYGGSGATCGSCGWTNAHAPNCPFKS